MSINKMHEVCKKSHEGFILNDFLYMANAIFAAFSGTENIDKIWNCTTRLRVRPISMEKVDISALTAIIGVKSVLRRTEEIHLVIGWDAAKLCAVCNTKILQEK